MRLRIIDKSQSDKHNGLVEIRLTGGEGRESFLVDYSSPSSRPALQTDMAWYFADSVEQADGDDRNVIDRFIALGRRMGDALLGDDLQLQTYRDQIEDAGYSRLSVSIESGRTGFFEEPWEALVLPDAKYMLSSAAAGFTRVFKEQTESNDRAVLHYGLSKDSPANVIHSMYLRRRDDSGAARPTAAYAAANEQLRYDGAVSYRLEPVGDGEALSSRIYDQNGDLHVFRYQGPLVYDKQMFHIPGADRVGSSEPDEGGVTLSEVARRLKTLNCALVLLDVDEWLDRSGEPLESGGALAAAAQIILRAGIPNVVGLSCPADSWTANECFSAVYDAMLCGLSLAQSVVEARKQLQGRVENSTRAYRTRPVHKWPLLVHYEQRPVVLFDSEQPEHDLLDTGIYADIRRKMHGFDSAFLPPYVQVSGDSLMPEGLWAFRTRWENILLIDGGQGSGKTQLLHMLAFYLVKDERRRAFYFDYREHFYTAADIEEMIAPVIAEGDVESDEQPVTECLFVLDNFDCAAQQAQDGERVRRAELETYLNRLNVAGNTLIAGGNGVTGVFEGPCADRVIRMALRPLSTAERRRMASHLLSSESSETAAEYRREEIDPLLEQSAGIPFLVERFVQLLRVYSPQELTKELDGVFVQDEPARCVDTFHEWQWNALTPVWRRWLALLVEYRGLILEMPALVCDGKSRFEPVSDVYRVTGEPDTTFSDGISVMERAGFVIRRPTGRFIDPRCVHFLKRKHDSDEGVCRRQEHLSASISRIVCRSLVIVIPEVVKKTDQAIIQYLLSQRHQWAKDMVRVWDDGNYGEFSDTLSAVSDLMQQVGLSEELAHWALDRIERAGGDNVPFTASSPERVEAWMKLVLLAVRAENAAGSPVIERTSRECLEWIQSVTTEQVSEQAKLFTSVVQFLNRYYRETAQWDRLREAGEVALREYRAHKVWPLVVQALDTLIKCCVESGDGPRARVLEQQLLDDVPMDEFPKGYRWQLHTKVITHRLDRSDFDSAQELLGEMSRELNDSPPHTRLLDMLQADIYYRQEKLDEAAQLYDHLIADTTAGETGTGEIEFFRKRRAEIREKAGRDRVSPLDMSAGSGA